MGDKTAMLCVPNLNPVENDVAYNTSSC